MLTPLHDFKQSAFLSSDCRIEADRPADRKCRRRYLVEKPSPTVKKRTQSTSCREPNPQLPPLGCRTSTMPAPTRTAALSSRPPCKAPPTSVSPTTSYASPSPP